MKQKWALAEVGPHGVDWSQVRFVTSVQLPARRAAVLRFVDEHQRRRKRNPTYREIAAAVGVTQTTVGYHVSKLVQAGLMKHDPRSRVALQLTDPS